eukprot:3255313-Pyramimonas_sp.AAC.1
MLMLRLFAPTCSRANQYVYPKPSVPALVVLDRTPLGRGISRRGAGSRKQVVEPDGQIGRAYP